jgi:H+-transporting ATPase
MAEPDAQMEAGSAQLEDLSLDELQKRLSTSPAGLATDEARLRLAQYGYNELEEKHRNLVLELLSYFWGPIPWMIEAAAVLSAVVRHWEELYIILFLLVFNAVVGFWQEFKASNALEALKGELAIKARVFRDGKLQEIPARELVPGDAIQILQGDIIPADGRLAAGKYLSTDESALTGESLPVDKTVGDLAYSGSIARQGEMTAFVVGTGMRTKFGLPPPARGAAHR